MKTHKWIVMGFLLAALIVLAACRQQEADNAATPTIVLASTAVANSNGDDVPAYPAPDDAVVPIPPAESTAAAGYPAPVTTPEPEPSDPGEQPQPSSPVVPVIVESAVVLEPLPEAAVFAPPEGDSGYATGSTVQHSVIRGDWLLQVARCYGTTYEAVRDANYVPFPDYIVPGTTLSVPNVGSVGPIIGPPCVVETTVLPGDTWESLAQGYDTTAAILQNANPGPLTEGRVIFVPTTAAPSPTSLPTLTHHLIFNFAGNLAIWRSTDSLVELTIDDPFITEVSTNDQGRYVLARQTRDGEVTSEIAMIDTVARTSVVVESGLPTQPQNPLGAPGKSLHVSPDGMWAVYVVRNGDSYDVTSFQTAAPGTRYSVKGMALADVGLFGVTVSDGVDNTTFVLSDPLGLFEFPYSLDRAPRTILAIDTTTMQPASMFVEVEPVPGGQYLLALGAFMEGGAYFAVDEQTGAYGLIPGSGGYVTSGATFAHPEGTLTVVSPTEPGALGPMWITYQPQTSGDTVTLAPVNSQVRPTLAEAATSDPMPGYVISAPKLQDGALPNSIAIMGSGPAEDGFWRTGAQPAELIWVNSTPAEPFVATWVPDGSALLASTFETATQAGADIYISDDMDSVFSLSDWLGGRISDPYWVRQ